MYTHTNTVFVGGFKEKLIYFMRTVPSLGELLKPLEDTIRFNFIPAITGAHLCSDNDRILLLLPVRFAGLAIPLFHNDAKYEYENSRKLGFIKSTDHRPTDPPTQ